MSLDQNDSRSEIEVERPQAKPIPIVRDVWFEVELRLKSLITYHNHLGLAVDCIIC